MLLRGYISYYHDSNQLKLLRIKSILVFTPNMLITYQSKTCKTSLKRVQSQQSHAKANTQRSVILEGQKRFCFGGIGCLVLYSFSICSSNVVTQI